MAAELRRHQPQLQWLHLPREEQPQLLQIWAKPPGKPRVTKAAGQSALCWRVKKPHRFKRSAAALGELHAGRGRSLESANCLSRALGARNGSGPTDLRFQSAATGSLREASEA
ncbi:histone H3.3C-like [Panthera leo]|uniref:histone H3.3C-like n=1 Tax=Panthera leo TaxID=9689 RepID=UPI001C6A8657|nr:histone H3.3C-like [Panthera leo]